MPCKYWKVRKGVYSGITARGKRFMGKMTASEARKKAGGSRSSSSGSKTKTSKKRTGSKRKLTKKRKRGSRKFTIPIAPIAGILAAPAVGAGIKAALAGDVEGVMYEAGKFVGIKDGKFDAFALGSNVLPIVIGCLVHKFVGGSPLNLNRMLARANVPVIRI